MESEEDAEGDEANEVYPAPSSSEDTHRNTVLARTSLFTY